MLARTGELPTGPGWAYELKWDGVRAMAHVSRDRVRLCSRNERDVSATYPELQDLRGIDALLDGEIVALDERGHPSFERLQRRMHVFSPGRRELSTTVTYMIFDLLELDGDSLLERSYDERRAALEALGLQGPAWQTPAAHHGDGAALLEATAAAGLEGLVCKRRDSSYQPGQRTGAWVKVRNVRRQELVVGGWLPGRGSRGATLGSLLVGYHDDQGRLRFAGAVGSGLTERMLRLLRRRLDDLRVQSSPFSEATPRGARFVAPEIVVEVRFSEWTGEGRLRHPVLLGLREDVPARDVVREPTGAAAAAAATDVTPDAATAIVADPGAGAGAPQPAISNPDKVLFPATGFTKGDLIDYYTAIAPVLLPHLAGRALTLKRYPDGVEGKFFYEKNCPSHRPDWVHTARIGDIDHCVVDDLPTLRWVANLASIELHTSLARAAVPERPTLLAFDLDPGAPAQLVHCCEVALVLRGMLEGVGLRCLAKTSGGKGMQVYAGLNTPVTHAQTKAFARAVARLLAAQLPDLVVDRMTRSLRAGRVLVDWSQNDAHKTTVCVYSVRAQPRPMVSAPLRWEEVRDAYDRGDADPLRLTSADVLQRVRADGDLFAAVLSDRQTLPAP